MKRRSFLAQSGAAIGGSWVTMGLPSILATAALARQARAEGAAFEVLSPVEAAEFEAMAAQIIPTDDTPGAREAGVIHFMDRALAGVRSHALEPLRAGLGELQASLMESQQGDSFAGLNDEQQKAVLESIQDTEFFATVRFLTIAGMFCLPSQGGNRDHIGWQLIGFEGPYPTQPPFGYYDADYVEKGA